MNRQDVRMHDESGAESDELRLQKRDAYRRLSALWQDALVAGIEPEILAHSSRRLATSSRPMGRRPSPLSPSGCRSASSPASSPFPTG
jgi:hypothetical protein